MLAKCYSAAVSGVEAQTVEIEVFSTLGNSQFAIVGLPDQAVKEAKDRIPTALKSQGLSSRKELDVTVNLAPADVKKEGPVYDLPIAVGLLKATGKVFSESLGDYAFAGELALSGEIRRVKGVLPMALEMKRIGRRAMLVPEENADEASVVEGIDIIPVRTLQETVQYLNGERAIEPRRNDLSRLIRENCDAGDDFADVKGQQDAKSAIEVAVAALHYTWEDLDFARHRAGEKRHRTPLVPRPEVCVDLDVRQTGLGGGSCGPGPLEENVFDPRKEVRWTLEIRPVPSVP